MAIHSKKYKVLVKLICLNVIYWGIVFPFLILLLLSYLSDSENDDFFEVYGVVGFLYISIVSTVIGVIIHFTLNLSEVAQKDLFIT